MLPPTNNFRKGLIMENKFFNYWFKGFEFALEQVHEKERLVILKECAKACSDSYTRKVYTDEYSASKSIDEFLKRLKKRFAELDYEYKNNTIIFTYNHCYCDLVTEGYLKTPLLCDCSRLSLQQNWEAVVGKGNVEVILLQSILWRISLL
jgi:hypothetical protein